MCQPFTTKIVYKNNNDNELTKKEIEVVIRYILHEGHNISHSDASGYFKKMVTVLGKLINQWNEKKDL